MSTTTILLTFSKELAEKNFSKLIKEGIDSLDLSREDEGSWEQLKHLVSELYYAYQGKDNDLKYFLGVFREIYLYCGSHYALCINSPVGDFQHTAEIEALARFYKLPLLADAIPTKDGFIELYSKVSEKDVNDIALIFSKDSDYEINEAKDEILNTLKYLKPIVKTLKEDKSSFLVISHDYDSPNILPQEVNDMISKRVNELWPDLENNQDFLKLVKESENL